MKKANLMALAIVSLLGGCGQDDVADQQAIRQVMLKTWDRPQSRLEAGPIAVSGSHAVADWSQGEMGGRALFEKRDEKWVVTLCGGEALRTKAGLLRAGMPADVAEELADDLSVAERSIPASRLAKMAKFAGEIRMDGGPQR
jgi:hypothetical protein